MAPLLCPFVYSTPSIRSQTPDTTAVNGLNFLEKFPNDRNL
jgi:hypothetical protein